MNYSPSHYQRSLRRLLYVVAFLALISIGSLAVGHPTLLGQTVPEPPPAPELWNSVEMINQLQSPSSTRAGITVDICNKGDGELVEEWANLGFGQRKTIDHLHDTDEYEGSNPYHWKVTTAGSNCSDIIDYVGPFVLKNGTHLSITLTMDYETNPEGVLVADVVVINPGGPDIFLPIVRQTSSP